MVDCELSLIVGPTERDNTHIFIALSLRLDFKSRGEKLIEITHSYTAENENGERKVAGCEIVAFPWTDSRTLNKMV